MPASPLKLIVNADDFGYTRGVNRAIVELHKAGAISSATLMATGQALDDALAALVHYPPTGTLPAMLAVGCHVVLVDGEPVLGAQELPSLAFPTSQASPLGPSSPLPAKALFRPTLGRFVSDLLRGRIHEDEIEREAVAQIRMLQARGVQVTHLDTHKHTHMFARVLRPLLRAALQCGVRAIRNPFEPGWSIRATPGAPLLRRVEVNLLTTLRPEFIRLVAEAGLLTTAGTIGVVATGMLDAPLLECLLRAAARQSAAQPGQLIWELVCHPGYHDAELSAQRTRLLGAREIERSALAQVLPTWEGLVLTHFGELLR